MNHGSTLATLIMRALALREGVARPASAAQRRELWDRCGVIVDDLASRVLVLNLPAQGDGLAEWLTGAARYGTPFQVTLHQLDVHPIRLTAARLFACENPAVLRRACAELGVSCPPLVCAEGQSSTAFHRLSRWRSPPAASSGITATRLAGRRYHHEGHRPPWRTAMADDRKRLPVRRQGRGAPPWPSRASPCRLLGNPSWAKRCARPDGPFTKRPSPIKPPWRTSAPPPAEPNRLACVFRYPI